MRSAVPVILFRIICVLSKLLTTAKNLLVLENVLVVMKGMCWRLITKELHLAKSRQ